MKVLESERNTIRELYVKYRSQGLAKQSAREMISQKIGRGMTTIFDHTYDLDDPQMVTDKKTFPIGWPKTYIITGWELRVGMDEKFIDCLKSMAKLYDAELLLVPVQASDARYLPEILSSTFHIVTEDVKFNNNLQLKYVETHALAQSPLTGHVGAYPDYTTIIPGLIKELRTEPSQHYVKQVISTGSVGYLNAEASDYTDTDDEKEFLRKWRTVSSRRHGRPTAIASNFVVPSALIVDVLDSETFVTRFVSSYRSGIVYDLDKKFTATGYEQSEPLALVVGDTHAYSANEDAIIATKEMIQALNPREVVLNDFMDNASVNHHEIASAVKFFRAPSIEEEARVTRALLEEFCEISRKVTYLQSNHDDFLIKVLDKSEQLWRLNGNYEICCELQLFRVREQLHPIIKLLNFETLSNLTFVSERENHYVGRVLVKHGHEGVSGVRAGFLTLARIYNFYAQGHSHNPGVYRNAMCVGTTADLDMDYAVGANAWLHANGLVQPDNSTQLLPIINGRWR